MSDQSTILGPDGRPFPRRPVTREVAEPTTAGVRSPWHQPVASGLTPHRLARVLRDSMQAGGDATEYLTLCEEVEEREWHYRSVMHTRKLALRGLAPVVEAVSTDAADVAIADEVRALVTTPGFRGAILDLADALAKGYAVVEIMWAPNARQWAVSGFRRRDQRHFQFDRFTGEELRLRVDSHIDGEQLPPAKFIIHVPKLKSGLPIRNGLARVALWAFMLKSFGLKDWMAFLDIYGVPPRIGKWHAGATDEDKRALLRAVTQIAADAGAIIPESMVIEALEAKGAAATDAHEKLLKYLDEQVSKVVLGQTMTTDSGSSRAQAEVHDKVRIDIGRADADELAATIQRDLIEPFVFFNHGVPRSGFPKFTLPVIEPEDLKALMEVTGAFVDRGGRVSAAEVRDKLGWGDPEAKEDVLHPLGRRDPRLNTGEPPPAPAPVPALNRRGGTCVCCGGHLSLSLHRQARDPYAEIDRLAAAAADDWEPVLAPVVDPLLALAREASSFDEVLRRLPEVAGRMDSRELAERLARLTAIARGLGDLAD